MYTVTKQTLTECGKYGKMCAQRNILTSSVVNLPFPMQDMGCMLSKMLSDVLVVCRIMSTGNFSVCSETKLVLYRVLSDYDTMDFNSESDFSYGH
jgi:hypothetical protein